MRYFIPRVNKSSDVPRYREINTYTARKICKDLDIPKPDFK